MSEAPVRLERDGDVAVVVLDSPPLNLFTDATFEGLRDGIAEIGESDARAAVFRAEGDIFTGGVDVNFFDAISGVADATKVFEEGVSELMAFERLQIPTIALVHGLCLTAGMEAALSCDMIWASESASFGLVERVVGLTPAGGGTQRVAERAGPARAREFVMSGRVYDAATMERWGVVNRVIGDGELLEKGMKFARDLAAGPTKAHAATKRVVRAFLEGGIPEADRVTPSAGGELFGTEDLQNAVKSFLAEGPGKATFKGR